MYCYVFDLRNTSEISVPWIIRNATYEYKFVISKNNLPWKNLNICSLCILIFKYTYIMWHYSKIFSADLSVSLSKHNSVLFRAEKGFLLSCTGVRKRKKEQKVAPAIFYLTYLSALGQLLFKYGIFLFSQFRVARQSKQGKRANPDMNDFQICVFESDFGEDKSYENFIFIS